MAAGRGAQGSGGATLQSCLQEFFQQEHITWECPKERQAKKELRRSSLGTDKELPSTPVAGRGPEEAADDPVTRRTVSFSGKPDMQWLYTTQHRPHRSQHGLPV